MGKIYTSYFAKANQFDDSKFIKIAISNSNPLNLFKAKIFIPDWKTIVSPHKLGLISDEVYELRYVSQLDEKLEFIKDVLDKLVNLDKDIILMCYESPEKFCHRRVLSEWIFDNFGYSIEEYKFCKENGIDLEKKYSVRYFLQITANEYGGDVIKQISKELTNE